MTESTGDNRQQMIRYLLGQAAERDATRLEERYFRDDDSFAELEAVADDLADRYAAGRLSDADRQQFERHCLGSQDDRLRLRVSQSMRAYVARQPSPLRPSFFRALASLIGSQTSITRFAVAVAGIVVVVASSVLSVRVIQLQQGLTRLRNEMTTEQAAQREASATAAQQAQQERTVRQTLEKRLTDLVTVGFVLVPGLERGTAMDLILPREAAVARFELALENLPPAGLYRLTLRTIDGATVWSHELMIETGTRSASLEVSVPAAALSAGQYEMSLQAILQSGAVGDVATYGFRIVRGR